MKWFRSLIWVASVPFCLAACATAIPQKRLLLVLAPAPRSMVSVGVPLLLKVELQGAAAESIELLADGASVFRISLPASNNDLPPFVPASPGSHVLQFRAYDSGQKLVAESDVVQVIAEPVATATPVAPLAITALPSPIPSVLPTATSLPPTSIAPSLVISNEYANLRSGPGQAYTIIGKLNKSTQAMVTGKSADGLWWQIRLDGASDGVAWVFGELVDPSESALRVTTVVAPVPPTPRPTATLAARPTATVLPTAVPATSTPNPDDGCNPSNPDWRGQGRGNPEYAFCVRKDLDFKDGGHGGQLELQWDVYGVQSIELRFDGGQRGMRQQVSNKGAYGFGRGDFPGCNKAELYITRKDGKVVGYNEKFWCSTE